MAGNNGSAGAEIDMIRLKIDREIGKQVISRAYRAANELRNASQLVLRGQRSGRRYLVPGTRRHYQASSPGEPPAVRTGAFRMRWMRKVEVVHDSVKSVSVRPYIKNETRARNGHLLGDYLENGTPNGKMAPRPHHKKIQDKALEKVLKIYKEPYF